ncbi:MAG: hypothetical protein SWO11_17715, partial [Thermodesulfobacteriota bacterium]|nr:hypothetical protein [Thermodesulfobacteriota bacterium]
FRRLVQGFLKKHAKLLALSANLLTHINKYINSLTLIQQALIRDLLIGIRHSESLYKLLAG